METEEDGERVPDRSQAEQWEEAAVSNRPNPLGNASAERGKSMKIAVTTSGRSARPSWRMSKDIYEKETV